MAPGFSNNVILISFFSPVTGFSTEISLDSEGKFFTNNRSSWKGSFYVSTLNDKLSLTVSISASFC